MFMCFFFSHHKICHFFDRPFSSASLCLDTATALGPPFFAIWPATTLPSPDAAARMAAIRCLARSSPWSAARTYQTLASRGSRWHPMPISVKYPTAYSALGRPDHGHHSVSLRSNGTKPWGVKCEGSPSSAAFLAHSYASFSSFSRTGSAPTMYHAQSAIIANGWSRCAAPV